MWREGNRGKSVLKEGIVQATVRRFFSDEDLGKGNGIGPGLPYTVDKEGEGWIGGSKWGSNNGDIERDNINSELVQHNLTKNSLVPDSNGLRSEINLVDQLLQLIVNTGTMSEQQAKHVVNLFDLPHLQSLPVQRGNSKWPSQVQPSNI